MALDIDRIEIERVGNLVRNFGWTPVKQETLADKLVITIEKPRVAPAVEGTEGAD